MMLVRFFCISLFRFVLAATLVAMVGAIVVELDFHVGLFEGDSVGQVPAHIPDVQATGYPHALVIRLYGECGWFDVSRRKFVVIEVFGTEVERQVVFLNEISSIGEEEIGVGLQVNGTTIYEEVTITLLEVCGRQALARILHLGVAER